MDKSTNRLEALPGWAKALLVLVLVFIMLAAMEVAARMAFQWTGAHWGDPYRKDADKHLYTPYTGFFYRPFVDARPRLRTDRYGFLHNGDEDRDLTVKDRDEFRVFIFGGSSVAGTHVASPQTTLAAMLEQNISDLFSDAGLPLDVRVVNAGVGGYMSAQEVSLLQWYVLQFQPDFVIFMDGSNDAVYWPVKSDISALVDENIHDYHARIFINYSNYFSWAGFFSHASKVISEYSALASGLSKLSRKLSAAMLPETRVPEGHADGLMDRLIERHIGRYRTNILAAIGLAKVHSIGIAYFLQPTLLPGLASASNQEKEILESNRGREWESGIGYFAAKIAFFSRAGDMIDSLSASHDGPAVKVANLDDVFDAKPADITAYGDRVHYTDPGREILAGRIAEILADQLLRQGRNRPAL